MQLAVTADLHWGLSPKGDAATRELARCVLNLAPDALAIAGDVGEGSDFGRSLSLFSNLTCLRLIIPGNHDLWIRDPGHSSLARYEERLPEIAAEHGFQYLDLQPYLSPDGVEAVVGSINWYDYSFADPELEQEYPDARWMYERKLFPTGRHNDGRFIHFGMSDSEFSGRVVAHFQGQLTALPATVERVIVLQHHPPIRELFYPGPVTTDEQRFWLAYAGNRRMEEAVLADPRVTTVLCGHTHAYRATEVDGRRCRNIGGDYDFKRLLLLDTETGEERWWEFR